MTRLPFGTYDPRVEGATTLGGTHLGDEAKETAPASVFRAERFDVFDVHQHLSGHATLYTYSIVYQNDLPPFRDRVPYVAAIVDLDEGPRMMTNNVDCPFEDLQVGMKLTVRFEESSDKFTVPMFSPAT